MRFDRLDLNLLVAFDVLLETQSVTDSARRLSLSQPSVSAALSRLRDFFGDELLVPIGRKMRPTAKALELGPAVKEMLNLVRFRITHSDEYDPIQSRRRFKVVASDYAYDVLLSKVIAKAENLSPGAIFDVSPPGAQRTRQFIDGDIDLVITVANYTLDDHPSKPLFSDEDCVICWNEGTFAKGLTAEQFMAARHAVAVFGQEQLPTITESHFTATGIEREVAVRVPGFGSLPGAVVGTNRIATLHRRHAVQFARSYPIVLYPLPVEGPVICEVMQWHKLRHNDRGLQWLMNLLEVEAKLLSA